MVIAIKFPDDDQPRRQPVQTGPYLQTDDGDITESTEYPHCPHCGEQTLATQLDERDLNKCRECGEWFFFRRIFETVYVTCTERRHRLN